LALGLAVSLLVAVPFPAARGATILVPGDYSTIQAGLSAAGPGETVLVYPGTYFENLDVPAHSPGIVLLSAGGPDSVTVDGGAAGSVITLGFLADSTTVIDGLTIENGMKVSGYQIGGGVLFEDGGRLRNCVVRNNVASTGGGIAIPGELAGVIIESCVITGNTAGDYGGGIWSGPAWWPGGDQGIPSRIGGSLEAANDIYGNTPDQYCRGYYPYIVDGGPYVRDAWHIEANYNYWGTVECSELEEFCYACFTRTIWTNASHTEVFSDPECPECPAPRILAAEDPGEANATWGTIKGLYR
jgi:hypothetical protein